MEQVRIRNVKKEDEKCVKTHGKRLHKDTVALTTVANASQAMRPRERKIAVKVIYKKNKNRKVFFS